MARVVVNGRVHETDKSRLSYEDVRRIATGLPYPTAMLSCTWKYRGKPETGGCLSPGESVDVREDMVFNAMRTDNA